MSSLIVCRILASNYQANNHCNRAGAKCPIFLVMQRALKIIFPRSSYGETLSRTGLQTLYARRQELTESLFRDIESNIDHKLHNLLPPLTEIDTILRNKSRYNVTFKTDRFRNNFITYNALKS